MFSRMPTVSSCGTYGLSTSPDFKQCSTSAICGSSRCLRAWYLDGLVGFSVDRDGAATHDVRLEVDPATGPGDQCRTPPETGNAAEDLRDTTVGAAHCIATVRSAPTSPPRRWCQGVRAPARRTWSDRYPRTSKASPLAARSNNRSVGSGEVARQVGAHGDDLPNAP